MSFITDNFDNFKKKVEPLFGPVSKLAQDDPDIYAHQVLSHGFMEYIFYDKKVFVEIDDKIKVEIGLELEGDDINIRKNPKFKELYWKYLKEVYLEWAKENKIQKNLIELGWEEYKND